eukprot:EG_transcript_22825
MFFGLPDLENPVFEPKTSVFRPPPSRRLAFGQKPTEFGLIESVECHVTGTHSFFPACFESVNCHRVHNVWHRWFDIPPGCILRAFGCPPTLQPFNRVHPNCQSPPSTQRLRLIPSP